MDGRSTWRQRKREQAALDRREEELGIKALPQPSSHRERIALFESCRDALQRHSMHCHTAIGALDQVIRGCYEQLGMEQTQMEQTRADIKAETEAGTAKEGPLDK